MNENAYLSDNYNHDQKNNIWIRKTASPFQYSDGDQVEERIGKLLKAASDKSVFSDELKTLQIDWPTAYYFSANRSNLLRPLEKTLLKGARVLELGCGMGAITRFLGEAAGEVIAVEGSPRRGAIAAIRCQDLPNVHVLIDEIKSLPSSLGEFDIVTLVGVLEYARRYGGPGAEMKMLEMAKSFLKPDGFLILAIENKLGLKYFAGVPEDHIPRYCLGITNGYRDNGVCTWSRKELADMLRKAGFNYCQQFIPLPDYKLPTSIITPEGLAEDKKIFDLGPILNNTLRLFEGIPYFNLGEGWQSMLQAGLLEDMANSLCFVATMEKPQASPFEKGALAYHYGDLSSLPKKYAKEVKIKKENNGISVLRESFFPESPKTTDLYIQKIENEPYYKGELLFSKIRKVAMRPDWSLEEFFAAFDPWVNALLENADENGKCDGRFLDFTPFNIIITEDGKLQAFDQEWISKNRLHATYLLHRGFINTVLRMLPLRKSPKHDIYSFNEMFQKFLERLRLPETWPASQDYLLWQETKFNRFIKNNPHYTLNKDLKIYYMP